jgi:DNA-binding CsgD family transcriptional regulator
MNASASIASHVGTELLMNIATSLGELTRSLEHAQEIPAYLRRTLLLPPVYLAVVHQSKDGQQSLPLQSFSGPPSDQAPLGREHLLSIYGLTKPPGEEQGPKPVVELADFPGIMVYVRQIDSAHRMLLVIQQKTSEAPLAGSLIELLDLVVHHLAKGLSIMLCEHAYPAFIGRPFDDFTDREWVVVRLLESEMTEKQMADQLQISPYTIHSHIKKIYRHLGVRGRLPALKLLKQARRSWRLTQWNQEPLTAPGPLPKGRSVAAA